VLAVVRQLRRRLGSELRLALFTLPFEIVRLRNTGDIQWFDAIYEGEKGERDESEYRTYIARTLHANRLRLHHAIVNEQPTLLLTHWMMLNEIIDGASTARVRVVSLLEENEWSDVIPGLPAAWNFGFADDVIFADNVRSGSEGLGPRQKRVGCLTEPPSAAEAGQVSELSGLAPEIRLVTVNSGGGAYVRTHDMLDAMLHVAAARPDETYVFLIGPLVPPAVREALARAATSSKNVRLLIEPERGSIRRTLERASLVVTAGGTNSVAEALVLKKKVLVVNPNGTEFSNDLCRLRAFEQAGLLRILHTADVTCDLTKAVGEALDSMDPAVPPALLTGAADAAELLIRWLAPPGTAQADAAYSGRYQSTTKILHEQWIAVFIFDCRVPLSVRSEIVAAARTIARPVTIDLPVTFESDTIVRETEMTRVHSILAYCRAAEKMDVFLTLAAADDAPLLAERLVLPDGYWILAESGAQAEHEDRSGRPGQHLPERVQLLCQSLASHGIKRNVFGSAPAREYPNDYVRQAYSPFGDYH